jgi:hypothetical protein
MLNSHLHPNSETFRTQSMGCIPTGRRNAPDRLCAVPPAFSAKQHSAVHSQTGYKTVALAFVGIFQNSYTHYNCL